MSKIRGQGPGEVLRWSGGIVEVGDTCGRVVENVVEGAQGWWQAAFHDDEGEGFDRAVGSHDGGFCPLGVGETLGEDFAAVDGESRFACGVGDGVDHQQLALTVAFAKASLCAIDEGRTIGRAVQVDDVDERVGDPHFSGASPFALPGEGVDSAWMHRVRVRDFAVEYQAGFLAA